VLALASVISFASVLPTNPNTNDLSWYLYAASALLWMTGMLLVTRAVPVGEERWRFPWLLVPIVVLAFGLRVSELNLLPYGIWYDEAMGAVRAEQILREPNFRPIVQDTVTFLHYLTYLIGIQLVGTGDILGPRLAQATFGTLSVIAAYCLGRELRGETFGLIFAFIIAVMRWSINFSRIAMTGVDATFFILIAFWLLVRLARSGHLRDALFVGMAVGLGLWFYRAFQFLLIPLGIYLLLAWRWSRGWRALVGVSAVTIVTVLVFAQPLGLTAIFQPDRLFGRVEQTSIFSQDLQGRPVIDVMRDSAVRHIGMFVGLGDRNGRHNLPGAPMLDPVTGALFISGLLIGVLGIRKPENTFGFLLIGFSLSAGVLTVPSEAPQGLRAIGAIPAVGYFAALSADILRQGLVALLRWLGASGRMLREATVVGALALGAPMLIINYDIYFNQMRHDYRVWSMYSTDETVAARYLQSVPPDVQVWASPNTALGLNATYLNRERVSQVNRLDVPASLPIRTAPGAPLLLLFARDQDLYLDEARRLYPNARVEELHVSDFDVVPPSEAEDALLYAVHLTPQDVASVQGLENGEGILYAPRYGEYTFFAPTDAIVTVDGVPYAAEEFRMTLAQGNHALRIQPPDSVLRWLVPGAEVADFIPPSAFYRPFVGVRGLLASYYPNAEWGGEPTMVRLEPFVYRYIHIIPMSRPYSVIWRGSLYAPSNGSYTFGLRAMRYGSLAIDGQLLVESNSAAGGTATVTLTEGWHPIELRMRDTENFSRIYLEWMLPGSTTMQPVVSDFLRPE
jgi:hypothetical protein